MECFWDPMLLQRGEQLPHELLNIIRDGSNERYLEAITKASLDARHTYTLLAHCDNIFPHICATLPFHGNLASAVATLGRVVPIAPYLAPYATLLLTEEDNDLNFTDGEDDQLMYLLGLFRLLSFDWRGFKKFVKPNEISTLLESSSRPVVYLAIRILQIYLFGADHWFEQMVKQYLGEDTPNSDINGLWDDKIIDYRFLTLWEEDRLEKAQKMIDDVKSQMRQLPKSAPRVISESSFHKTTAVIGGLLLPRIAPTHLSNVKAGDGLLNTTTISNNLNKIASGVKSQQPLLLTGLAGSGKTLLIRHIASRLCKVEEMVTLHLNEQSDAKLLIGIYTTGDLPGSFVWKPGVLTTAVQEGRWVLIEDLDRAPNEIIGALLPLIEKGELYIPSRKETIHAGQGFKIVATVRNAINHRGEETKPLLHMLGARHWRNISITMPPMNEQLEIVTQLFPSISPLIGQFMAVYERLLVSKQRTVLVGQTKIGVMRVISPRDLLKWCSRVTNILQQRSNFTSADVDDMFMEAIDCFVGALPDCPARAEMAAIIAEELRIDPRRRDYLLMERDVRYEVDKNHITIGRYNLPKIQKKSHVGQSSFSTNPHTSRMLERVAATVVNREPLLLVGETGIGKTTAVQHLASHLGKKLVPFNLSQQSESGDLLGGFKPVSNRSLIVPLKDEFDDLFSASFSASKNQQFLELLGKQMAKSNWKAVCKLWHQALKMVDQQRSEPSSRPGDAPSKKRKIESKKALDFERWDAFAEKVSNTERRIENGSEAFAFSFIEGSIIKALRNGDWILLDEINLAAPDTLEAIADIFDSSTPSIMLAEAGNIERIQAHPEFRVFAAMNPATDVGKKDLPPGIRSCFTELYVESPDKDLKSLQSIVRSYLRHEVTSDQAVALDLSTLYQKIITLAEQNKLVDGAGQRPHFSLRTLTRTLSYAKYIAPMCNLRRALYEGFQMSFITFLDVESARLVQPLLDHHLFGKRTNVRAELQKPLRKPNDGHEYVQGYPDSKHWVRQGSFGREEQSHYILTPFIRDNLENLVRASSTRQFPVLIQGPTSSGKTSMIEYLAKRTGHKFVRINNHEHTDLQEYLGTYVSGTDGRLQFQEGILVKALREGHWIVLDELNLAPTDVLEALNRLLDDNRELLIPETQEVVRPHESFMLFATQNPAGLYGGRKTLSRAFRNRFLELHFDDIPIEELQDILHQRTQLPESRCKRIVTVYKELSLLRQENRLFEQKSFATLRDLFRWAFRPNDTIEQLAANGFMLLGERVRKPEERQTIKEIIERVFSKNGPRVSVDENALYAPDCKEIAAVSKDMSGVVWTKAMRRIYVLVSRAIEKNEPVLLVGETGCGKTTVCQMLAAAFGKDLHTVNAHQSTETGDLIGSQRPVRNRAVIEATLRHQLLSSPLLQSLENAAAHSTEVLLDAYDHAVASLGSAEKESLFRSSSHLDFHSSRIRFKALFEWVDGSLVQAMKAGSFFLLDEISLADDSVLERINSVLESQRSILLAEKGSLDSYVTAATGFQFFATMNPGGDYGKRELSPALRNRFTEIWVPSLDDVEDVSQIIVTKLIDVARPFTKAMVEFARWFRRRYNTSASASVSIRDALAWVDFVNAFSGQDLKSGFVHGAAMVYIDSLGANPAAFVTIRRSLDQERMVCLEELSRLAGFEAGDVYFDRLSTAINDSGISSGSFSIPKMTSRDVGTSTFVFDPPTTSINAMRVIRALQLEKPVMLEGSPGVGKTALVTAIADAVGMPLTRINLSEQTDLIDLFGSDVPEEGKKTGTFIWRDAPFLRAMKNGEWVLLDEMNLASQSVLEGLNACLDHRGEVFVPELGQSFIRHPGFRLFAAQNPHHQGGGRKGLPTSFVNRFTVVFADAFRPDDLLHICRRSFPAVDCNTIQKAVQFMAQLDHEVSLKRIGTAGAPWEFNLRDINRWLSLASTAQGLLTAGSSRDFVNFLFLQRFRSAIDRDMTIELFSRHFDDSTQESDLFPSISTQALQVGLGFLPRDSNTSTAPDLRINHSRPRNHLLTLQSLMLCVQQKWPVILVGASGIGKSAILQQLSSATGASIVTLGMNADTDAMDLIGGYEQADPLHKSVDALRRLLQILVVKVKTHALSHRPHELRKGLRVIQIVNENLSNRSEFGGILDSLKDGPSPEVQAILHDLKGNHGSVDKGHFKWTDGVLIDALQTGKWLVLDNANLCSPSVLDRLNSLLEPNGTLMVNEHSNDDGSPRIIYPHPNFRIFLTMDPKHGELSRAMRNRAVELCMDNTNPENLCIDNIQPESALARLRFAESFRNASISEKPESVARILYDHTGRIDQPLLSRFSDQLQCGLYEPTDASPGPRVVQSELGSSKSAMMQPSASFYQAIISQMQAPADFAYVQTLHPLNNQALVRVSQQNISTACYLALVFDISTQIVVIGQKSALLEADTTRLTKLQRLERSINLKSHTKAPVKESIILSVLREIPDLLFQFLQQTQGLDMGEISLTRNFFQRICEFLKAFVEIMQDARVDATTLIGLASVGQSVLQSCPAVHAFSSSSPLKNMGRSLMFMIHESGTTQGLACEQLWAALKPPSPSSTEELDSLLRFEAVMAKFDLACHRFELPLSAAVDLRLSIARTLDLAIRDGHNLHELSEKLQEPMSDLNDREQEETDTLKPNFYLSFRYVLERLALVDLNGEQLPQKQDTALLEILALTSSKNSLQASTGLNENSAQNRLRLLGLMVQGLTEHPSRIKNPSSFCQSLLRQISSGETISLGRLKMLQIETKTLAKMITSRAGMPLEQEIVALDSSLEALLHNVLQALLHEGSDLEIRQMSSTVMSILREEKNSPALRDALNNFTSESTKLQSRMTWLTGRFIIVVTHLRTAYTGEKNTFLRAANAWAAFAMACIHLYIPPVPLDPAFNSQLERHISRRHRDELRATLGSLRRFREASTGHPNTLRAMILEQDLQELDSEQPTEEICRPESSEMGNIQAELQGFLRIIRPLIEDSSMRTAWLPLDSNTLFNLVQIRSRLSNQHRSYDDFTTPVVGFIDCLLVAHRLANYEGKHGDGASPNLALRSVLPFVEANRSSWLSDDVFVNAHSEAYSQQEVLCWLGALALRSPLRPALSHSTGLRQLIHRQFRRYFEKWKAELSAEQRRVTAKSSLYKFKGGEDDDQEPTADEIEEMFPSSFQGPSSSTVKTTERHSQNLTYSLAGLHFDIFVSSKANKQFAFGELIRQWAIIATESSQYRDIQDALPAIMCSLGDLDSSLYSSAPKNMKYNIYTDSNVTELERLAKLLDKTKGRFHDLHLAWPEHATPPDVLRLCEGLLQVPHSAPLSRFLPQVEKLHASINEWQKITSREFSATTEFEDLTSLIIGWRQLELSTWNGLFDREWQQCERDAASWWFVAYETIIAASIEEDHLERHTVEIVRILEDFLTSSGHGEFAARLQILRGFEANLAVLQIDLSQLGIVRQALNNVIRFYEHYENKVSHTLSIGRRDLEGDIKKIIQLASWKDRNIDVLRQSAQSSHKKLLRLVRKYRKLLAQPVTQLIQEGIPADGNDLATYIRNDSTFTEIEQEEIMDIGSCVAWSERPDRFRNAVATAQLIRNKTQHAQRELTAPDQLKRFSEEIQQTTSELKDATPNVLTEKTKTLVSHLKTRKRRLLADVLRDLRSMGFQSSMSEHVLIQQRSVASVLARISTFGKVSRTADVGIAETKFHRLLGIMSSVRNSAVKHSEDLTAAEVNRSVNLLESMCRVSITQHNSLCAHLEQLSKFNGVYEEFDNVASCGGLDVTKCGGPSISTQIYCLRMFTRFCFDSIELHANLVNKDYPEVISDLKAKVDALDQLQIRADSLPRLPQNMESSDDKHVQRQLDESKAGLQTSVQKIVTAFPELQWTTSQTSRWMESDTGHDFEPQANGQYFTDFDTWVQGLFSVLDLILSSIQDAEKVMASQNHTGEGKAWIVVQDRRLTMLVSALRAEAISYKLSALLSKLQHFPPHGANCFASVTAICRLLRPIFESYHRTINDFAALCCDFYGQLATTGYELATSLLQLLNQGFCSPGEKADGNEKEDGEVETGTGLGQGEGAEDISKDVGDNEDLSEVAQEASDGKKAEDLEDEKDAVDMADEEMEGDAGDPQTGSDQDGSGSEDVDNDGLEEEPGKVDDFGPSNLDEKMWDAARENEQEDKQGDKGKSGSDDQEVAAAGKQKADDIADDNDASNEDLDETGVDTEEIERPSTDQVDTRAEEEQNLELPEDMTMDGPPELEDNRSDTGSLMDDISLEENFADNLPIGEDRPPEQENYDNEQEQEDEPRPEQQAEDSYSETAAAEDTTSDVLMKNENDADSYAAADELRSAGLGKGQQSKEDENQAQQDTDEVEGPSKDSPRGDSQQNQGVSEENSQDDNFHESAESQGKSGQENRLPFKQLGDTLQQWYDQRRAIEEAKQQDDIPDKSHSNQDMAKASFEHLATEDTMPDTQALGAAPAEQSTALNEEQAIPVNEEPYDKDIPIDSPPEDTKDPMSNETHEPSKPEPNQSDLPLDNKSRAIVGDSSRLDQDLEMTDVVQEPRTDEVEDVDQRLVNTHISHEDLEDELSFEDAREAWARHENNTRNLALMLTEHLRLILQPTQATKMRGDFRTGKRLNIKRIIPYVASSYKRDKIWMRRSVPTKRSYQVMLAIDDSKSMRENQSQELAFETLALIVKSMSMLEIAELSVLGFGQDVNIVHDFGTPFNSNVGGEIFRQLNFSQSKTDVRRLLVESTELLRAARLKAAGSASDLWQLQLIVSDGICEDHPSIRQLVRQAHEERIMIVFVVVDTSASTPQHSNEPKQSIFDLQTAEFAKDESGEMQLKMVKYLDTFPFRYYLIVRDVRELPGVLAGALRQWFAEVMDTGI